MEETIKTIYGDLLMQVTKLQTNLKIAEAQLDLIESLKDKSDEEVKEFINNFTRNR